MMNEISLFLADDHPIYLEGLANLLKSYDYTIIGTAADGKEAVEKVLEAKPDIVLMDANMPVLSGIKALEMIKASMPEIKVLILTGVDDDSLLFEAIQAGASGFLLKNLDGDTLHQNLQNLLVGNTPFSPGKQDLILTEFKRMKNLTSPFRDTDLTEKQYRILEHLSNGCTYKEIGSLMFLSERTVKYHIKEIKNKYNLDKQIQLIEFFRKLHTDALSDGK